LQYENELDENGNEIMENGELKKTPVNKYLYVIEKIQAEGVETNSVEGKIAYAQRIFEREMRTIKSSVSANQKETRSLLRNYNEKNAENKNKIVEMAH